MLIYSSEITIKPEYGLHDVFSTISRWLSNRCNSQVDASRLSEGIRDLSLNGGYHITSRATLDENRNEIFPYLFCVQLSHPDDKVSGRRWVTEIGVRQDSSNEQITCTFLLKTEEISARVTSPIQVTRPKIVELLATKCNPLSSTPGLRIKNVDEHSAKAFLAEVERESRQFPIVFVSPTNQDGVTLIEVEKLQPQLLGIADIAQVVPFADTYAIEKSIGRKYSAFNGAINVIFPPRNGKSGIFCETVLYLPNNITNNKIIPDILASITHRTNLPFSWRHISLELVSQANLRRQLTKSIEKAKTNDESAEYAALLEEADKELIAKDREISDLRLQVESIASEKLNLESTIDGLKYSLSGKQSSLMEDEQLSTILPLREAVSSLVNKTNTLQQSLVLISVLFPDRVVVLDTAIQSANESLAFKYTEKAFELLWKLINDYWTELNKGGGDRAKEIFGNSAYAQNEGDTLSNEGRRRRAFNFGGRELIMLKHLKIGVKDSVSETLRIHFEWLADENKIIIGHCGKHLDV